MKTCIKNAILYIAVFAISVAALTVLTVGAALIPRSYIRKNMERSAEKLCSRRVFFMLDEDLPQSKIDWYGDSILLNIVYHWDEEDPLYTAMHCSYYYTNTQNENYNLRDAVTDDLPDNKQYLRYWHGSGVLVKLWHLFGDIYGMYICNGVIMTVLIVILLMILLLKKMRYEAAAAVFALAAGGVWYVPLSLEYTWAILWMLMFSIIALLLSDNVRSMGIWFFLSGIVMNYFDFLTTETLGLLVPILLVLAHKGVEYVKPIRTTILWFAGYSGMWIMKWVIASFVLGENVFPEVSGHVAERLGGYVGVSLPEMLFGALTRNIRCLFPLGYGATGAVLACILMLAAAYFSFVYRKPWRDRKLCLCYLGIALIPYVRYLVMHNHSYIHYFFTYRAQIGTVLAICLTAYEVTRKKISVED